MSLKQGWAAAAALLAFGATAAWAGSTAPAAGYAAPSGEPAYAGGDFSTGGCAAGGCAGGGCATGGCASGNCHSEWCCPKYTFTIERPPHICFKRVCPKPVCNPCDIEGYGYYPTCWRPWAYPPNYNHCPVPPPGVLASQPPPLVVAPGAPAGPGASQDDALPPPRKSANPNPDR